MNHSRHEHVDCGIGAPVLSVDSWTPERSVEAPKEPAENKEQTEPAESGANPQSASTGREPNSFEKYDEEQRRIESLMRDAIAEGDLDPFIRSASGQPERLIEKPARPEDLVGMLYKSMGGA